MAPESTRSRLLRKATRTGGLRGDHTIDTGNLDVIHYYSRSKEYTV